MRLRTKIYYMAVGFHVMGCLISAMAGAVYILAWCFFMSYASWRMAEYFSSQQTEESERENNE